MHPYPNIPNSFWGVYSLGCETPQFILCTPLYKIVCFVFLLCSIKGLKLSFFFKPWRCKMANKWAFSLYIMQMKASEVHETCVAPHLWSTLQFDINIFAYLQNSPRTTDLASYWKPSPCNIKKTQIYCFNLHSRLPLMYPLPWMIHGWMKAFNELLFVQ